MGGTNRYNKLKENLLNQWKRNTIVIVIGVVAILIAGDQAGYFNAWKQKKTKNYLYQETKKNDSDSTDVAIAWFNVGCSTHDPVEALLAYDKAVRLNPRYVEAYNDRGVTKGKLNRHREAIADFDMAISLKDDFPKAYLNRGISKLQLWKYKEAIVDFDMAINLKPDDASTYYVRGMANQELREYQAAIADYNIALALLKNKPEYADLKAEIEQGLKTIKQERNVQDQE